MRKAAHPARLLHPRGLPSRPTPSCLRRPSYIRLVAHAWRRRIAGPTTAEATWPDLRAAVAGLMKDGGSGRRAAVDKAISGMGGRLESFYFALGDTDAFLVVDVSDTTAAVAVSLAVNATGAVRTSMTPLLTVEEMDAACKKTVAYRAPGA